MKKACTAALKRAEVQAVVYALLFIDHVAFSDCLCRTSVSTFAAGSAFIIIDNSVIVCNMDSVMLAGLFALFTAYAAVFADAACYLADICGAAAYVDFLVNVTKNDDMVGTCLCTDSAADTFRLVNSCKTVLDDDSVLRTNLCAVTETETAVSTYF